MPCATGRSLSWSIGLGLLIEDVYKRQRHNRARGAHNIELMCNIVAELDRAGMSDQWIMKNIGMDRDELLRLKQISGLADLFANKDFSIPDNKPEYMP